MPFPEGESPGLRAEEVTRRYDDVVALDTVSLTVEPGECLALVGESGSGKTTLLRCFNRMVEPDGGRVLIGDREVSGLDPIELRRRVGYVQQEGGLLPHWTVARNAALVPWLRDEADATDRAGEALEMVGLAVSHFGSRRPGALSGGQRQRVAIARALAGRPGVLLMDEPFGALDAITRAELHDTFRELRQELDTTTLLVTHDLHEAAVLADRIAVLQAGRIEQVGAAGELVHEPASDYVRRLVDRARLSLSV